MRTFTPDADCINMQFELPASDPVASGAAAKAAHLAADLRGSYRMVVLPAVRAELVDVRTRSPL
jgi:hypothetical protein